LEIKSGTKMVVNWDMYLEMERQQQEISDEEIDKQADPIELGVHRMFFKTGAKWYREQLKQKK